MTFLSKVALAAALALSAGAPAMAQTFGAVESQTMEENNVYLFMDGKMIRTRVGDLARAEVTKQFKPLKNGTMIYSSGGRLFMAETTKMSDGKMLHSMIFGPDVCPQCN